MKNFDVFVEAPSQDCGEGFFAFFFGLDTQPITGGESNAQ